MASSISIFGSINMDLVVYCSTEPLKGETIIGDSFETFQGGKGANQAVAVSRLGSSVSLIGKVGSDVFGQQLLKILGDENIDISMLKEHSGESGTAFIYVYKETSENQIIVIPGANSYAEETQIDDQTLSSTDIVVSQLETRPQETQKLFSRSRKFHCYTILNTAPAIGVSERLIEESDLLVMNESELSTLSGDQIFSGSSYKVIDESIKKVLSSNSKSAIVTLGSRGAYVFEKQKGTFLSGLEVVAIDSTGSGDCFVGALASHYSNHGHLLDAANFANQAASLSVMKKGASASMPYLNEVVNPSQIT
jgi:ribokinase